MEPRAQKILWVEDDSFLTNIISQRLLRQQWQLLYASEGKAALRLAHDEHPAVIILDILLPGMDGVAVLTELKADETTKNIPVIMFTNLDDTEKIERCKELGIEGFFVKATIDLDSIIAEIQKILSR